MLTPMTKDEIRRTISELLADFLEEDKIELADDMVADDVDGWDSIVHMKLVLAIEEVYGIRFESEEINAPENVGALLDLLVYKCAEK